MVQVAKFVFITTALLALSILFFGCLGSQPKEAALKEFNASYSQTLQLEDAYKKQIETMSAEFASAAEETVSEEGNADELERKFNNSANAIDKNIEAANKSLASLRASIVATCAIAEKNPSGIFSQEEQKAKLAECQELSSKYSECEQTAIEQLSSSSGVLRALSRVMGAAQKPVALDNSLEKMGADCAKASAMGEAMRNSCKAVFQKHPNAYKPGEQAGILAAPDSISELCAMGAIIQTANKIEEQLPAQ